MKQYSITEWSDDYLIGIEMVDEQHKKWIEIYNEAHDRMMDDGLTVNKRDIGKDALKKMIEYGKFHFSFEEKFMEKIGFPEIEDHKKIHENFVQKLDSLALQLRQGIYVLNSEIIKLIENWLVDHILNEDRKYIK